MVRGSWEGRNRGEDRQAGDDDRVACMAPLKFDGAGIPGLGPVHGPVPAKGREVAWIWY